MSLTNCVQLWMRIKCDILLLSDTFMYYADKEWYFGDIDPVIFNYMRNNLDELV